MATLNELAAQVVAHTNTITKILTEQNIPFPSFAADGPSGLPRGSEYKDLQKTRLALIDAARAIEHLATGPEDWIKWHTLTLIYDSFALSALAHFNVFAAVPLDGVISYVDLGAKVGLSENRIRRIIRQAMTSHIFTELRPGYIAHTATSALLVKIPSLQSFIGHNTEDGGPASVKVIEAIEKWGDTEEPAESGFGIAFGLDTKNGKDSVFRFVAEDGEGEKKGFRLKRIGDAMESVKGDGAYDVAYCHQGFNWDSLGKATIVDLGGSIGHLSIEIASKHSELKCIVQDFPELLQNFEALRPESLADRVIFQGHDIFSPQPIKDADAYVFRLVHHDWPDSYCVQMLQQIVQVMKKGSKIIIIDAVMDKWSDVRSIAMDRMITSADLHMMAMMNAKERMQEDWISLFEKTTPKLKAKAFVKPEGSALGFIEVIKAEE